MYLKPYLDFRNGFALETRKQMDTSIKYTIQHDPHLAPPNNRDPRKYSRKYVKVHTGVNQGSSIKQTQSLFQQPPLTVSQPQQIVSQPQQFIQ